MSREIHRPKPSLSELGAENLVSSGSGTQCTYSTEERNDHSIANDETICRNRRSPGGGGGDGDGHEDGHALPSFRLSLFNDANDSGKDRRTDGRRDGRDGRRWFLLGGVKSSSKPH